jgi:hypothetical protein
MGYNHIITTCNFSQTTITCIVCHFSQTIIDLIFIVEFSMSMMEIKPYITS